MMALKRWQLLGFELFNAFTEMERVHLGAVLTVTWRNLLLFEWRNGQTLNTVLVPWSANIFAFLVPGIFAKISFLLCAALPFQIHLFCFFYQQMLFLKANVDIEHRKRRCTLSAWFMLNRTMWRYLLSILHISPDSTSLLRFLAEVTNLSTSSYLWHRHWCFLLQCPGLRPWTWSLDWRHSVVGVSSLHIGHVSTCY